MTSHKFNGYPHQMREDMVQEGVLKIIKNLKNMKEEYKSSFFTYWSTCVFTAATVYLAKYYRGMNKMRAMLKDALVEAQTTLPQYTTHAQELIKEIERQI